LAAFSYGSIPILPPNEPAGPIVKRCQDKVMRWIHENVAPVDKAVGTGTGQARFRNVRCDPKTWTHVRRITSLPQESFWPDWIEGTASRMRDGEAMEIASDEIIARQVDFAFFPAYFHNLAPPLPLVHQIQGELEELEYVMGDRRIVARWPLALILATKSEDEEDHSGLWTTKLEDTG
jgi:hypothetical protein